MLTDVNYIQMVLKKVKNLLMIVFISSTWSNESIEDSCTDRSRQILNISHMPSEIMINIFSYFNPFIIKDVSLICHEWHSIIQENGSLFTQNQLLPLGSLILKYDINTVQSWISNEQQESILRHYFKSLQGQILKEPTITNYNKLYTIVKIINIPDEEAFFDKLLYSLFRKDNKEAMHVIAEGYKNLANLTGKAKYYGEAYSYYQRLGIKDEAEKVIKKFKSDDREIASSVQRYHYAKSMEQGKFKNVADTTFDLGESILDNVFGLLGRFLKSGN